MRNLLFRFPLFLVLTACSLSAKQEANLNLAISKYVQARNECHVVSLVAYTYPELVHYFKNQGDSLFKHEFDCASNEKYAYDLFDPTIKTIKSEGSALHVEYNFKVGNKFDEQGDLRMIALSDNKGETWYFMEKDQYLDKKHCKKLKRLIN